MDALQEAHKTLTLTHESLQKEYGELSADLGLADAENAQLAKTIRDLEARPPAQATPEYRYSKLILVTGAELRGGFRFVDGTCPRFEGSNGDVVFTSSVQRALALREPPEPRCGVSVTLPGKDLAVVIAVGDVIVLDNGTWITHERWNSLDW